MASGTLKGEEADPARIRSAMLAQRRTLLVTDAPEVARAVKGKRDKAKTAVLEEHFRAASDLQVRVRRVTVYEQVGPAEET
ncbi:hypothetical protein [Streptomyces sp. UG1]|uniref:hypothetical protein n=1 Tax=Streptomyces sp. UG1 TaxID=3417652 RepID=UPI003CF3C243